MSRLIFLLYGLVSYALFFGTFLYAIYFVFTMTPDRPESPLVQALLVNGGFLGLFAVQHSVMARPWFKKRWTRIIPEPIERSTFVLLTSLILLGMITYWKPLPEVIWSLDNSMAVMFFQGLSGAGFLLVLVSTFLIDHFDLFGLKQVWDHWNGRTHAGPQFHDPLFYRMIRHPLYLGFMIAFWSTAVMTVDHLFFAVMTTGYMLVAIQLEEHDLITFHPGDYESYRKRVPMLIPWRGIAKS